MAGAVGYSRDLQKERVVHSLRSYKFDRNFAVQAVPRASDEIHSDGFGDVDRAVRKNGDLRVEFFDAQFFSVCGRQNKKTEKQESQPARGAAEKALHVVEGLQAVGAAGELKLTLGASRSVVEVTSKNSRGLKPSMPAKILVGNCWILVFRSRTTAL